MARGPEGGSAGQGTGRREQPSGSRRILETQLALLVGQAEQEGGATAQAAGCCHSDGGGREKWQVGEK